MTVPRLVVGGVIIDRSGDQPRVLAARRTGPPALAGLWEFPGGKVEIDEIPELALARELREELSVKVGVTFEILPPEGTVWPISDEYVMRLFVCAIDSGQPIPGDSHDEIQWFRADELRHVRWLDSDTQALGRVEGILTSDICG